MSGNNSGSHAIAEVLRTFVLALVAFGLIVAGFYAKNHGVDDTFFFYGAGFVIVVGVLGIFF
ncbi:MAG TPA: hypothetical protein VMT23_00765 [Candidatus Binatia bacterium]|nr:hypothetical protein [Candidatus Binatia bacterium]